MTDLSLSVQSSDSPFDSLKRVDENGKEYWNARELQVCLGYEKWQNFNSSIKKASIACQNAGNSITEHFLLRLVKSKGRPSEDWRLSRYACYLVGMNSDPEKPEIALAQSYFAIKTREAEVQQQRPKTALELAKEQVALLERLELQEQIIADQEKDLLRQAEVIDELFDYSSIIRIAKFNNVHEKSFNWRMLKAVSIKMNLEIKKVPDPNFGTKNLYHHDVWRFAYPDAKLPDTTTLVINN